MAGAGSVGWDAKVCWRAIQALHHDSDPYAEGIVALRAFHSRAAFNPKEHPPLVYVYSPITLILLRLMAMSPGWILGLRYGVAFAAGVLLQLWAGFQMADRRERRWLALMLPVILFFPGLVTDDAILSGNVAYLFYGVILAAAVAGWKRGRWLWYYIAVLAASLCKMPFLALLAFPVLVDSNKRQWVRSGLTAVAGVLIFAAQVRFWPGMLREYLLTLRLMFDWEHDFGYGPAGILGKALWQRGLPSSGAATILYLAIACGLGVGLLSLARRVREWNLSTEAWVPVALVGTALLNPRIMKYDLAAISVPMLLIGWRALRFALARPTAESQAGDLPEPEQNPSGRMLILAGSGCLLIPNVITIAGPSWFPVELVVLLAIFAMGVWSLDQSRLEAQLQVATVRAPD
ncbi:MAG: hypothetical protein WCF68_09015 [Terriglobales bacterium]